MGSLLTGLGIAQDAPDLEDLRPRVLFTEDFERYAVGSREFGGKVIQAEPIATARIDVEAGGNSLPSKQLVVSGGALNGKWIVSLS